MTVNLRDLQRLNVQMFSPGLLNDSLGTLVLLISVEKISSHRFISKAYHLEFGVGDSRRTQQSLRLLSDFLKIEKHYFQYYGESYKEGRNQFVYFEAAAQIFSEKLFCHERQLHSE